MLFDILLIAFLITGGIIIGISKLIKKYKNGSKAERPYN